MVYDEAKKGRVCISMEKGGRIKKVSKWKGKSKKGCVWWLNKGEVWERVKVVWKK